MRIIDQLTELLKEAPAFPDQLVPDPDDPGFYDCPLCDGDGTIWKDHVATQQSSAWAGGVQFYGIGHEHLWCENFYLAARKHMPALLAVVKAAEEVLIRIDPHTPLQTDDIHSLIRLGVALAKLNEEGVES